MASAAVATAASSSSSSSSSITMSETRPSTSTGSHSANANANGNANSNSNVSDVGQTLETSEATHQKNQPQHHNQQQQQQQHNQESRPAAAVEAADNGNGVSNRSETPLPGDLRRIISEVAKMGACTWLSWDNQDGKELLPSEYAASLTACIATAIAPTHNYAVGTATKAAAAALGSSPSLAAAARQPFSTHRRSASSSPYAAAISQGPPPRKKHRNGLHKSTRRRLATANDATTASRKSTASGGGRKRPLFLIRTNPNTQSNANAFAAPGSVGSGRTSGSEPDDSTQYECDSEGTSATTNSEVSVERLRKTQQRFNANNAGVQTPSKIGSEATSIGGDECSPPQQHYKTLQEAFRVALGLVLDNFYRHCGGYKLSPAEKRRNQTLSASAASSNCSSEKSNDERRIPPLSSEDVFQQRRQKLLTMLLPNNPEDGLGLRRRKVVTPSSEGPPFTIQRIAEVLVAPERYYTQTHKLCNCLEKLLLVRSSTGAFGGNIGGDTSQSRREECELAALADEKGRQESVLRQRRLRRRTSSPSDDLAMDSNSDGGSRNAGFTNKDEAVTHDHKKSAFTEKKTDGYDGHVHGASGKAGASGSSKATSREMLEAAARASLRTKFDHAGIDAHSSPDRDVRHIAESRGMTNSPPPPSLAMSPGHAGVAGFVRHPEHNSDHHTIARVPSPILFSPGNESPMHATRTNMHMLQLHHAVALAGVSLSRPSPSEYMTIDAGSGAAVRPQGNNLPGASETADLEADHGRSSAYNSDVDSESDDISLDDSASDRSDGSDSGSAPHYEPFTAARAMALNRMQQQQRLQSRVLTSLSSLPQSEGFRPPADSEYQSGDSIDSMRAEDSGGSDSSSASDLAD